METSSSKDRPVGAKNRATVELVGSVLRVGGPAMFLGVVEDYTARTLKKKKDQKSFKALLGTIETVAQGADAMAGQGANLHGAVKMLRTKVEKGESAKPKPVTPETTSVDKPVPPVVAPTPVKLEPAKPPILAEVIPPAKPAEVKASPGKSRIEPLPFKSGLILPPTVMPAPAKLVVPKWTLTKAETDDLYNELRNLLKMLTDDPRQRPHHPYCLFHGQQILDANRKFVQVETACSESEEREDGNFNVGVGLFDVIVKQQKPVIPAFQSKLCVVKGHRFVRYVRAFPLFKGASFRIWASSALDGEWVTIKSREKWMAYDGKRFDEISEKEHERLTERALAKGLTTEEGNSPIKWEDLPLVFEDVEIDFMFD